MFCWDKGIERGYSAWSWQRHDDFIWFPQLAVGDLNLDGQNEILMLSHMCVWVFDNQLGGEITRMVGFTLVTILAVGLISGVVALTTISQSYLYSPLPLTHWPPVIGLVHQFGCPA